MTMTTATADPASPLRRRRRRSALPQKLSRSTYLLVSVSAFVAVLLLWAGITATGLVNPMFLPSPAAVVTRLWEQVANGELFTDLGASIYRVMGGYLGAIVIAIPLGVLAGTSVWFEAAVEPMMDFIRYMPVVAFVPLTILWVGTDDSQKFLIIFLGTFFQCVLMVSDAVRTVPRPLHNLGATLGMGRVAVLGRIVIPASMPRIWDSLRICLGWAWTWLVVAELVAATSGMGYRITQAQRFLATDTIIGYVIVLGVLGLIMDQLMRAAGRMMFRYQQGRGA